jgi:hypothetical protein
MHLQETNVHRFFVQHGVGKSGWRIFCAIGLEGSSQALQDTAGIVLAGGANLKLAWRLHVDRSRSSLPSQ